MYCTNALIALWPTESLLAFGGSLATRADALRQVATP
jgi:hypothetical protein